MSRIAYVNGRYVPLGQASVSIDDRAFMFGDGVYEVCEVRAGALIEETRHLARLGRSLAAVRIARPMIDRPRRLSIESKVISLLPFEFRESCRRITGIIRLEQFPLRLF